MNSNRVNRGYWTIEKCFEEATKYNHRSDFKKQSGRAYYVLCKNHLLDEACKHMAKKDTITKWTKENCIKAAQQCKTKSEFNLRFCGAMKISKKRGWYNELVQYFTPIGSKYHRCIYVCEFSDNHAYVGLTYNFEKRKKAHLQNKDSSVFKYIQASNLEPLFKQVTEYIDYGEASIKEGEILNQYKNNGWTMLNKAPTGGLGSQDEVVRKWTEESCLLTAKKCSSYKQFSNEFPGALEYCKRHGIIDKIKDILPPTSNNQNCHKWTLETALEECNKYATIKMFTKECPSAYNWLLKKGFQKEIRQHKTILQRDKWTLEEAHTEALKYDTKKAFKKSSNGCYGACQKQGWLNIVCSHMRDLNEERKIYNPTNVKQIVQQYDYMEQLKKNEDSFTRGCYWWLKKNNLIQEYKQYLNKSKTRPNEPWTDSMIELEYKKYKTYQEFREKSKAYQICVKRNLLTKVKKFYGKI